jgi:cob(I)alamin adenosyltransferase
VAKHDPRIVCIGSVDELSSFLGLAAAGLAENGAAAHLLRSLHRIQRELYLLGAELGRTRGAPGPSLHPGHVAALDAEVEALEAALPRLTAFILPGGGQAAAALHVARAVCRRAEREAVHLGTVEPPGPAVIPYLNRLSLVLFAMARTAAHLVGTGDVQVSADD